MPSKGRKRSSEKGGEDPVSKKPRMSTRSASKTPPAGRKSSSKTGASTGAAPGALPTVPVNWYSNLPEDHGKCLRVNLKWLWGNSFWLCARGYGGPLAALEYINVSMAMGSLNVTTGKCTILPR